MAFCALMLACLWIVQTVFLEDIYTNIKLNQTEHCANLIASSVKTGKNTVDAVAASLILEGYLAFRKR